MSAVIMARVGVAAAIALGALVAACGGGTLRIPTQPPSAGGLTALLGPVHLKKESGDALVCIVAVEVNSETVTALVWPNGYMATGPEPVTILDASLRPVAKVGDVVWLGGGLSPVVAPLEGCESHGRVWWIADLSHSAP